MRQLLNIRKRGIAQIMLSQYPHKFLDATQTLFEKPDFPEELQGILFESFLGQCVSYIGNEYVERITWSHLAYRTIFMTNSVEQRLMGQILEKQRQLLPHRKQEMEKEGVTQ